MDHLDGIASLPEQVAKIAVGPDLHAQFLRQPNRAPKNLRIASRDLWIWMYRISVATQSGDHQIVVIEFFLPRLELCVIREQVLDWTMLGSRVAARANLHRLQAVTGHLVQHFIQRKMVENRIKNSNGYFSRRARRQSILRDRRLGAGRTPALRGSQMRTCNSRRQQPTRSGQELSAAG